MPNTCYWPNRDTAPNVTPCSSSGDSACCPSNQPCTENGLCYDLGYLQRGACTDKSWGSSACPKYCYLNDGSKQSGVQNGTNDILTCGNYIFLRHFVCAKQNSWGTYGTNYCTSDTVFQFPDNGVLQLATLNNTTAAGASNSESVSAGSTTQSAPTTSSSTQSSFTGNGNTQITSSSSSDNIISGGTIGAAVVAAIMGLLFMITLGMLIAERRKRRTQQQMSELPGQGVYQPGQSGPFGNEKRTELSGSHPPVHEML